MVDPFATKFEDEEEDPPVKRSPHISEIKDARLLQEAIHALRDDIVPRFSLQSQNRQFTRG